MKIKYLNNKIQSKNIKGIWLYGLSGSGKTYASKIIKFLYSNSFLIDGDVIRKYISFDLGYDLESRKIQLARLYGISVVAIKNKTFPIVSSVYMNKKIYDKLLKKKILPIKIYRKFTQIKNTKINKLSKNVVGKDIKYKNLKTVVLKNPGDSSFKKKIIKIFSNE